MQGSALTRRFSVNSLAWTADGGSIVFGYDDGLCVARPAAGAARLTLLDTPKLKSPEAVTSPSGRYLLLFEPSPRPPGIFEVWDLVTGSRTRVLNPGLIAWEVAPR